MLVYFKYLPYSLVQIRHTYIFTNVVEAVKPGAQDPTLHNDLHNHIQVIWLAEHDANWNAHINIQATKKYS